MDETPVDPSIPAEEPDVGPREQDRDGAATPPIQPPPAYPMRDAGPYAPVDLGTQQSTSLGHPFRLREQIWDRHLSDWVPYYAQPPLNFGNALFVLNHRRYTRDDDEEVTAVVEVLDSTLVNILRDVCHDLSDVYNVKPIIDLKLMYPHLEALAERVPILQAEEQGAQESAPAPSAILRSFLEVVEREFIPHREKMERLLAEDMITFEFLWKVFKIGQKICDKHLTFRDAFGATLEETKMDMAHFHLAGHTLAWNGTEYISVKWTHDIMPFGGPKALSDLGVTVLTDPEHAKLTERGRKYVQFSGIRHVEITGQLLTLTQDLVASSGGRAILDMKAFKQARGDRDMAQVQMGMPPSPGAGGWGMQPPGSGWDWAAPDPTHARPRASKTKGAAAAHTPMDEVPEELLWMLPATLGGYSFSEQTWGEARVTDVEHVTYDERAWDRLVLDPDTKTLIRSLVHVRVRRDAQMLTDWIKGKGGGLVVLLHGVSGVGKTFTAEAVAELLHRPLYVVGSAELGSGSSFGGSGLEAALKACLKRATAWNAVLLIDEADVWLEKRSDTDLWRNSEVATFLRQLEYHSGVVFLTTNRVKSFDEAFLSRISIAIKYPELELRQRSQIWEQLLHHVTTLSPPPLRKQTGLVVGDPVGDLSPMSEANIKELALKPFNGRIIKNIVRTAQALSVSSDEPLSMRHLRIVVSVTEQFLHDTKSVRNESKTAQFDFMSALDGNVLAFSATLLVSFVVGMSLVMFLMPS